MIYIYIDVLYVGTGTFISIVPFAIFIISYSIDTGRRQGGHFPYFPVLYSLPGHFGMACTMGWSWGHYLTEVMSITYSRAQYTNYRLSITGVSIGQISTGSRPMDQYGGLLFRGAHCALTKL